MGRGDWVSRSAGLAVATRSGDLEESALGGEDIVAAMVTMLSVVLGSKPRAADDSPDLEQAW